MPGGGGRRRGSSEEQRRIAFRTSFSNAIYDVMASRGWVETESDFDWDILWAEREWVYEIFDTTHLDATQRLNHFRNGRELCRKDLLVKNLKRMKRASQREGPSADFDDFAPLSFVLPREYAMFVEEFKRSGGVWIMKPIGAAQGRGIFLFSRLSEISEWNTRKGGYHRGQQQQQQQQQGLHPEGGGEQNLQPEAYVVQRYVENPYLIGGKKFDVRLYVLVTSFSPLKAYLYRGGFARFSHTRYDPSDIANNFVHLTNVAVQKTADNYDARSGGKMDLRSLKLLMASRHGMAAIDELFLAIERVVVRSLLSVQHVMIADRHCFELYGYDVLVDDDLTPWLIEINASPSLSANTKDDYHQKCDMLNDTLDVVDLEGIKFPPKDDNDDHNDDDKKKLTVGGYDLLYDGGIVQRDPEKHSSTLLGTAIKRSTTPKRNDHDEDDDDDNARRRNNSSAANNNNNRNQQQQQGDQAANSPPGAVVAPA